jgi:hypothetical protein
MKPRQIKGPEDYRPGTVKGKIDAHPIWIVHIKMPKELIANFKSGLEKEENQDYINDMATDLNTLGEE